MDARTRFDMLLRAAVVYPVSALMRAFMWMKKGHAAVNKAYSRLANFLSINMKDFASSGKQAFVLAEFFMSCVVVT
eukprot:1789528-Ditylum_brightwellii.AAC.1